MNYPAIFDDGIKYHIIGQIWAENVGLFPRVSDIGAIAEKWPVYISQLGWDVLKNPPTSKNPNLIEEELSELDYF